jgi:hypothetical protein
MGDLLPVPLWLQRTFILIWATPTFTCGGTVSSAGGTKGRVRSDPGSDACVSGVDGLSLIHVEALELLSDMVIIVCDQKAALSLSATRFLSIAVPICLPLQALTLMLRAPLA